MFAAKPLASLSSGLLARKGQARPAMKPQGFAGFGATTSLEDLGWNDMGTEPEPVPAPADPAPLPPVLVQREELQAAVAAPEPEITPHAPPAPAVDIASDTVARIGREARRAGRAAFTLRLAADRHLRLRLASAVQLRSAQLVVTDALDTYLATLPQLEELARRASQAADDLSGE